MSLGGGSCNCLADIAELSWNKCQHFIAALYFRTIFRWITVKNLNTLQFDENLRGDTPMGLLRGIKHGTESYHVLFKRLCRSVYYEHALLCGYRVQCQNVTVVNFEFHKSQGISSSAVWIFWSEEGFNPWNSLNHFLHFRLSHQLVAPLEPKIMFCD
jgi:hypothetical protein